MFAVILILAGIGVKVSEASGLIVPSTFFIYEANCLPKFHSILVAFEACFFILFLIISVWKLWHVRDTFAFKWELLVAVLVSVPSLIVWLIARFVVNFDSAVPHEIWPLVIYMTCAIVSVACPVVLIYKSRTPLERDDSASFVSLESLPSVTSNADFLLLVLDTPVLLDSLKKFMVTNWSVENLLFLLEIRRYQEFKGDPAETVDEVRRIYELYLEPGSVFEVNLDSQDREAIMEAIQAEGVGPDIFETSWVKVFNIVKHDSVPRWRLTPEFQEAWLERRKGSSTTTF